MPRPSIVAPQLLLLAAFAGMAHAEETRVMIRARAVDAKFSGDQMGGVQITLTDVQSGAVLAKGLTKGGTGDTDRIMRKPAERWTELSDAKTAGFEAVLDLQRPTLVRADAFGPVGKPASAIQVTSTMWLLPGHHVGGDGWVLAFPGLVIEPQAVPTTAGLTLSARVTLMCGCILEPGGLWDAETYQVEASLLQEGMPVARGRLTYAGEPSLFAATLPGVAAGAYTLRIVATNAKTANAGVIEQSVQIPARR